MQTTTHSANTAQNFKQNSNGLFLIILLGLGAFLFYAIQSHLVTDCFVYLMSMLFDNFAVKSHSIIVDIILLTMFLLMMLGLFHLVKYFTAIFVAVIILSVLAAIFTVEDDTSHKPLHSNEPFKFNSNVLGG